ncbi:MAG: DoxX family protein [Thioalkalispiraceae bacterium]|jgi:putative oxidoreductase
METILQSTSKRLSRLQHAIQQTGSTLIGRAGGLEELCVMSARGLLGLFFIYFGLDKFVNYSDVGIYMSAFGISGLFLPLVILLEVVGGVALLVGWQLKRVAGLLAGFTLLTALIFHSDFSEQVQLILFMKNIAITGGLLLFVAVGAGRLSLDAKQTGKSKKTRKTR